MIPNLPFKTEEHPAFPPCVFVCVCVCGERETDRQTVTESMCMCVSVRVHARVCLCLCMDVRMHACVCVMSGSQMLYSASVALAYSVLLVNAVLTVRHSELLWESAHCKHKFLWLMEFTSANHNTALSTCALSPHFHPLTCATRYLLIHIVNCERECQSQKSTWKTNQKVAINTP